MAYLTLRGAGRLVGGANECIITTGVTLICRWTWKLDSNSGALFACNSSISRSAFSPDQ